MLSLATAHIDKLLTKLDELVRWRPGASGQYHDPHGALKRIQGKANHLVLGRRGSGKTRLLDELERASVNAGIRVVSIGAEDYKELTYPDILIQILRSFLREFESLLQPAHPPLSKDWLKALAASMISPLISLRQRKQKAALVHEVTKLSHSLDQLFTESELLEASYESSSAEKTSRSLGVKAKAGAAEGEGKAGKENQRSSIRRTTQNEEKRIKVERLLGDFKHLLGGICRHLDVELFLAVDDFYFIKRSDQPAVIDYIHRICKDTRAFLKVATIKHRSSLLQHENTFRGVVKGHEIQPIDLELPLGQFESIQRFLNAIWIAVCTEIGIADSQSIFKGDGFTQAVLASGGVPRDFFGIIKLALTISRERNEETVGKLRINEAARQYTEETKLPELAVDAPESDQITETLLHDIVQFARELRRKNCLHIDLDLLKERPEVQLLIDALVDARLLHLITDNTTNARKQGRYAAYLLDVGLYAHPQRRGEHAIDEVKFWERDEVGRLKHLARSPVYNLPTVAALSQLRDHSRSDGLFAPEPENGKDFDDEKSEKTKDSSEQLNLFDKDN